MTGYSFLRFWCQKAELVISSIRSSYPNPEEADQQKSPHNHHQSQFDDLFSEILLPLNQKFLDAHLVHFSRQSSEYFPISLWNHQDEFLVKVRQAFMFSEVSCGFHLEALVDVVLLVEH